MPASRGGENYPDRGGRGSLEVAGLAERLEAFFADPGLSVVAVETAVLDKATELRAYHGLRTPDAIQAASLLTVDPEGVFVTGDGDFKKIPDLRVEQIPP